MGFAIKDILERIRRLEGRFPKNDQTSVYEGHVHKGLGTGTGTTSPTIDHQHSESGDGGSTLKGLDLLSVEMNVSSVLTGSVNNYNAGVATIVHQFESDGAYDITGIVKYDDTVIGSSQVLIVHNVSAFTLTLKNESASSTAANRFAFGSDLALPPDRMAFLWYDTASGAPRWRTLAVGSGAGSGNAPDTADYLVGTAQAGLSAEIVVGTTPGGELGGTWAAPTVDTTHSGSAHVGGDTDAIHDNLASANGRTNESGKTYYWYALGGDKVQTGTYTGDGAASQTVLTAILSPVMVWVRRPASNSAILFYTTPMTTECHDFSATTGTTDKITGLTASGFTVGSHAEVNGAGATYHYVVFAAADNLAVGTYAGDGADDRELPATPMGFDPRLVHIKADAGQFCDWKVSSLAGDLTLLYGTAASVADKIQSLTPASGQFQVGQNVEVNNGALTYFFFAFGHAPLGGAPIGADYLVGTAQAGLSAEIVVGTAPGGELGGTWAAPTVDATHSGSA